MKLSFGIYAILAASLLFTPGLLSSSGQGTVQAQSANQIALLDVAKVFSENVRFKQDMEGMKGEAEKFQAYAQSQEARVKQLFEQLKQYSPGSPEYRKIDEDMARIRSETQVQSQLKQKELITREAKIYHKHYDEIQAIVAEYAARNSISLVLRWNSEPIKPLDRMSVQAGVNNSVVLQRGRDITETVILAVNGKQAAQARVPVGPTQR